MLLECQTLEKMRKTFEKEVQCWEAGITESWELRCGEGGGGKGGTTGRIQGRHATKTLPMVKVIAPANSPVTLYSFWSVTSFSLSKLFDDAGSRTFPRHSQTSRLAKLDEFFEQYAFFVATLTITCHVWLRRVVRMNYVYPFFPGELVSFRLHGGTITTILRNLRIL